MKQFLSILLTLLFSHAYGQKDVGYGLKEFSFIDKKYGLTKYYISKTDLDRQKPILLYLDGAGCLPLVKRFDDGKNCCIEFRTFVIDIDSLSRFYHIIMFSKPGLELADTIKVNTYDKLDFFNSNDCNETYNKNLSLSWRAENASNILNDAVGRIHYDSNRVIVMGISEGGQVAPKVAVLNNKITHCINICGSGVNQFYTPVIKARVLARQGKISYAESEKIVDSLFEMYKRIYTSKDQTDSSWNGHSYKRWSSFTLSQPLESYLKLDIPIYIAIGSRDDNGDVLSTDFVALQFLSNGKTNLTYNVYPGYDHFFNDYQTVNGIEIKIPKLNQIILDALLWTGKDSR